MADPNRLAAALSYEQDRPAFGNPNMLEQGRKMRERKQAEQVDRSAQNAKSDLLARALMYRYNPETLTGITDTPGPQTLDKAAGLDPRVDRSTFLPYSQKEGLHVPAVAADLMKLATASNPQYSNLMQPEEAMPLATNMMGGGLAVSRVAPAPANSLGMNVWHGSPHRFAPTAKNPLGEFDPMKIGTGEGAQSYGHGLYLAESPAVAGSYKDKLSTDTITRIKNDVYNIAGDDNHILTIYDVNGKATKTPYLSPDELDKWVGKDAADMLRAKGDGDYKGLNIDFGNLYKVDLPDEHIAKMLDWDKPLSQQAPNIQRALKRRITSVEPTDKFDMGGNALLRDNRQGQYDKTKYNPWILEAQSANGNVAFGLTQKDVDRMFGSKDVKDLTGEQIISRLTQQTGSSAAASAYLKEIGVPGIRYLDGVSRAGGQGTSNFVVFDPSHMNIIGRE